MTIGKFLIVNFISLMDILEDFDIRIYKRFLVNHLDILNFSFLKNSF